MRNELNTLSAYNERLNLYIMAFEYMDGYIYPIHTYINNYGVKKGFERQRNTKISYSDSHTLGHYNIINANKNVKKCKELYVSAKYEIDCYTHLYRRFFSLYVLLSFELMLNAFRRVGSVSDYFSFLVCLHLGDNKISSRFPFRNVRNTIRLYQSLCLCNSMNG